MTAQPELGGSRSPAAAFGPLLFQAVIARRPVTDEFLDELTAAWAARSDC
jgi:hypothetical protein